MIDELDLSMSANVDSPGDPHLIIDNSDSMSIQSVDSVGAPPPEKHGFLTASTSKDGLITFEVELENSLSDCDIPPTNQSHNCLSVAAHGSCCGDAQASNTGCYSTPVETNGSVCLSVAAHGRLNGETHVSVSGCGTTLVEPLGPASLVLAADTPPQANASQDAPASGDVDANSNIFVYLSEGCSSSGEQLA